MQENTICPGCGRHCDLERPHCGRGEEYRRTGNMPERQGKHRDQKMQSADDPAADINDSLIISLRDLHHTMRSLYEGKASQKRILIILNGLEAITQRDLTFKHGHRHGCRDDGGYHEGHRRRDDGRHHEGHGRRDDGGYHDGHGHRGGSNGHGGR